MRLWRRTRNQDRRQHTPAYVIRPYAPRDLIGVQQVEAAAFGDQATYPTFFFAQAGAILSNGFYVALTAGDDVAGYVIALKDQAVPSRGWILSLAIHPDSQRRGLGRELMLVAEERLRAMGLTEALLTVAESNASGRRLYERLGYEKLGYDAEALGPGDARIIMRRALQPSATRALAEAVPTGAAAPYDPNLMLGEAQSSIDFVNILFAVSLAVLAITVPRLEDKPVVALILFLVVISSFYASVFYAVVAGNVARLGRFSDVERSIRFGNVLSEYFGVYLVVIAFPLVVDTVANNRTLSILALCVDLLGFLFYIGSSFDLISRAIPSRLARALFHFVFIGLTTVLLGAVSYNVETLANVVAAATLASLAVVSVLHLRRGEDSERRVNGEGQAPLAGSIRHAS